MWRYVFYDINIIYTYLVFFLNYLLKNLFI